MRKRGAILLSFLFCILTAACSLFTKESYPFTDKARTEELLDIHESIAPTIPIDFSKARIVFFSDLHRGMGTRDCFEKNKELFRQVLDHYYAQDGFILVMLGDTEEGWGFQSDNVPIILQWHKAEYDIEKKFFAEGRYYRVYGNHDDYYRSNASGYVYDSLVPVYPALVFYDDKRNEKIFATHGCQGHGLHDAGDKVAAWGVFARYNWLLEILPNKVKESTLPKKMEKIKKTFFGHELLLVNWANNKKYDYLVAGHTHRPLYDSRRIEYAYDLLTRDIQDNWFPLFSGLEEKQMVDASTEGLLEKPKLSKYIKDRMINQLKEEMRTKDIIVDRYEIQTHYYNTGSGFGSEIPCIEFDKGNFYLKYFRLTNDGQLKCWVYDSDSSTKSIK